MPYLPARMVALTQASVCEIALALASLWATARALRSGSPGGALGFGLLAGTALVGALEYAGLSQWREFHQQVTRVVAWLTLALLTLDVTLLTRTLVLLALVGLVAAPASAASDLINVGALAILGYRSWRLGHRVALAVGAGIVLFVLAALAIGSNGELVGLPRRDLYHLSLCGATLLLMQYFRPAGPVPGAAASPTIRP